MSALDEAVGAELVSLAVQALGEHLRAAGRGGVNAIRREFRNVVGNGGKPPYAATPDLVGKRGEVYAKETLRGDLHRFIDGVVDTATKDEAEQLAALLRPGPTGSRAVKWLLDSLGRTDVRSVVAEVLAAHDLERSQAATDVFRAEIERLFASASGRSVL